MGWKAKSKNKFIIEYEGLNLQLELPNGRGHAATNRSQKAEKVNKRLSNDIDAGLFGAVLKALLTNGDGIAGLLKGVGSIVDFLGSVQNCNDGACEET
jgi:hypothetical protein